MSVARLCLGTAKLGMPWYGAGSASRPGPAEVEAILRRAFAGGIRRYDTAAAYGDAEEWLTHVLPVRDCRFVTKVSPALARLGALVDKLDDWQQVLLHNPTLEEIGLAWTVTRGSPSGRTRCIGVSIYDPAETEKAVACGWPIVQVPYCLLDRRHESVMREAQRRGVIVFARQPFLQGLLTNGMTSAAAAAMRRDGRLPVQAIGFWYEMGACCERHGISRVEACLRFALDAPADYVVFGVGSVAHLEKVLEIAGREAPAGWPACREELLRLATMVPPVVFPSLWDVRRGLS